MPDTEPDLDLLTELEAVIFDPDTWVEAYPRGVFDAGDVGGDLQAGTAWARQFVRWLPDVGLWAVVTDAFYPRYRDNSDDDDTVCGIQNQSEIIICTDFRDPGSTEVFADCEYDELDLLNENNEVDGIDDSRDLAGQAGVNNFGDPRSWRNARQWLPRSQ